MHALRPSGRMFAALATIAALSATLSLGAVSPGDHPTPSPVPIYWELDYEPGELRMYIDDSGQTWWYFTYYVENNTGDDRIWAPIHTLFTDAGEILRSGEDVPPRVSRQILARFGNPLLETQNQIIGDILQGEENALEGLVVWPARNLNVTDVSLFVAGISGETAEVSDPLDPQRKIIMQKTLQRDYVVPGEPSARGDDPALFQEERWVMR